MSTFIAISLPMNFYTRPPFNPWIQAHICCLSHCYWHCLQLTLPYLSTTPILIIIGAILMATNVSTTTTTTIKTRLTTVASISLLLPTLGRATDSRIGAPLIDFLSRMSSVNCSPPSATQLHYVHSFGAVANNLFTILLLVMVLAVLGSRTPMQTNTLHLILQIWPILHPILVMIICKMVTVRALPYLILDIPRYIP